jgi:hypothetical protein
MNRECFIVFILGWHDPRHIGIRATAGQIRMAGGILLLWRFGDGVVCHFREYFFPIYFFRYLVLT